MRLSKRVSPNGVFIRCQINHILSQTRYWGQTPVPIEWATLEHLHAKYSTIKTEEDATEFRRLFKELMDSPEPIMAVGGFNYDSAGGTGNTFNGTKTGRWT